jgi:hypothetical protein
MESMMVLEKILKKLLVRAKRTVLALAHWYLATKTEAIMVQEKARSKGVGSARVSGAHSDPASMGE